jgi:hypothetical protein
MTDNGREKAKQGALVLLKKKISQDKDDVLATLEKMLGEGKKDALDIRERSAREIYYRLFFALLSEDLINRVDEIKEMSLKDVFDRLIRLTRELREEKVPAGRDGPLIVIQQGKAGIESLDAEYSVSVTKDEKTSD